MTTNKRLLRYLHKNTYKIALITSCIVIVVLVVLVFHLSQLNSGLRSKNRAQAEALSVSSSQATSTNGQLEEAAAQSRVLASAVLNLTADQAQSAPSTAQAIQNDMTYCFQKYPLANAPYGSAEYFKEASPGSPNVPKEKSCEENMIASDISDAANSQDGTGWADDFLDGIVSQLPTSTGN